MTGLALRLAFVLDLLDNADASLMSTRLGILGKPDTSIVVTVLSPSIGELSNPCLTPIIQMHSQVSVAVYAVIVFFDWLIELAAVLIYFPGITRILILRKDWPQCCS